MLRRVCPVVVACLLLGAGLSRAEDFFFNSKGVKIHYTIEGRGTPVVLVHGFAASGLVNWVLPGISRDLAKDYRVITLDNRGHGKSGKPHDPRQYGLAMVDDVVRLMDHLDIRKAHVVGYSMGAFITHKLALRCPERLLSATLGGGGWLRADDKEFKEVVDELARSLDEGKGIVSLLRRLTPPGTPRGSDEQTQALNTLIMSANDSKALAAVMRGMKELTVTEKELGANPLPTLALIGTLDPLKTGVDALRGRRPGLEIVEIPGADHMTTLMSPRFRKSLQDFLARHQQP